MQHFHNMITKVMPDSNYGCTGFSFMFTQICEKISGTQVKKNEKIILGIILHIIFMHWFYKVILSKMSFNETERKLSIFFVIYSICHYIPFILQIIRMHDYFDQSSRKLKWTRVLENL